MTEDSMIKLPKNHKMANDNRRFGFALNTANRINPRTPIMEIKVATGSIAEKDMGKSWSRFNREGWGKTRSVT